MTQRKPFESRATMPTVPAPSELGPAYSEIFKREMGTLPAFSVAEVEAMHRLVTGGDGGHLNQAYYFKPLFQQFFEGREWTWPELETWLVIFNTRNHWPVQLTKLRRAIQDMDEDDDEDGSQDANQSKPPKYVILGWEIYSLLMRNMAYRAKSLSDRRQQIGLGISQWTRALTHEADQVLVEYAVSLKPDGLPPYFPGDLTMLRPIIPGIERN